MIGGVYLAAALWVGPTPVAVSPDGPGDAEAPAADRAEARAKVAFEEERWADAAASFDEAYRARPDPKFLFARAQSLRFAGRCAEAIVTYERFIAQSQSESANALAREAIELCRGESPPPAVLPTPPGPDIEPHARPPQPTIEHDTSRTPVARPWWRDPVGHAVLWPGVALTAAGSVLVPLSTRAGRAANDAPSEAAYLDGLDRANAVRATGITLVAAGAVAIVAGVVRFATRATKTRARGRRRARSLGLRF